MLFYRARLLIAHYYLKKGDPPADLRDADGFCYCLIRTVLSENLHLSVANIALFSQFCNILRCFLRNNAQKLFVSEKMTIFALSFGEMDDDIEESD